MNIGISLNRKYVRYAYVMLHSLYKNHPEEDIIVYALNQELNEEDRMFLSEQAVLWGNEVRFLDVDISKFPKELFTTEQWSLETYFRLQMLELLPAEVERILYIDIDVIVLSSFKELYYADFEGCEFCVCKDMGVDGAFLDNCRNWLFEDALKEGMVYFNAGVMLWNVEQLRKEYNLNIYMTVAKNLDFHLTAPDQDLLNLIHWKNVKYMDEYKYDAQARIVYHRGMSCEKAKEKISILHYTGYKPWNGDGLRYDLEKLWWDYAKETPLYSELLEEFLEQLFLSNTFEKKYIDMANNNRILHSELTKCKEMIQKLSALLGQ